MRSSAGLLVLPLLLALTACAPQSPTASNPPAAGFNLAGSDAQAIAIADATMEAMGGREAWDMTRHLTWRFFGGRRHVWDKFTNNHRFENGDLTVLMNLDSEQGRAWRAGTEITDAAELQEVLQKTKSAWINDSYWLVMPYKLKDSGVTLTYVGEQPNSAGAPCDVLQLTFANVGRTPDNKYHVFVDQQTHLVSEWTIWFDAAKDEPRSLGPWTDWQRFGDILLAPGHGERSHTEIGVFDELPASVYTAPIPTFALPTP
ncbi:hypothetical protein [Actomonas aquatica]|uniref:Uncharacterized protein n=1 Tax=Actomonas aquatica TaxID=2866162 RepID=A0ABZ1CH11_9BACT|nr:hypothetical protein [Opitutus sp. WL0086]WRQ89874.1 hypothetical protein K1X11_010695 [Opitutus sp. WL0086]